MLSHTSSQYLEPTMYQQDKVCIMLLCTNNIIMYMYM